MLYNDGIKGTLRKKKITIKVIETFIKHMLGTNDKWLYRALVRLYDKQTLDEKILESTNENNLVGFNSVDAELLSSYAKQYIDRSFLTDKQKLWCRNKMSKYWEQVWNMSDQTKMIDYIEDWIKSENISNNG